VISSTESVRGRAPMFPASVPGSAVSINRRRQGEDSRQRICAERHGRPHMMSAEMFRGVLIRERKRADRSSDRFTLLLVDLSQLEKDSASRGPRNIVVDAIAAAKRETDVMGWFEDQSVIGLIVPQLGDVSASEIERRVREELVRRLDVTTATRIALKVHVHAQKKDPDGFAPVEPLLGQYRARSPRAAVNDAVKRALDIVGSLMFLIALAPVMLIVAILVKATSRGPVFFKQKRIGQRGKPFEMLKFRSMRPNAGSAIHQDYVTWFINSSGKQGENKGSGVFKITNDPRITPIGRILRNSSLDELPQFFNVLMGEMSLVGPRPPLPYEVDQYKAWHCRRVLEAKPGITGLWQVTGRSRTKFDEMVRLDLRYARSYSFWTDIKILLATPKAVISGKGAC